jgi:hypothetical protein
MEQLRRYVVIAWVELSETGRRHTKRAGWAPVSGSTARSGTRPLLEHFITRGVQIVDGAAAL